LKAVATGLSGVLVLEPRIFQDHRGALFESYNRRSFAQATGVDADFVQDNFSSSKRDVLRGIHYQVEKPQGKLIHVLHGEIFDVAVDLRRSSPTFRRWFGTRLSSTTTRMLWIPPGFGHGLLALSERADVLYKMTELRVPELERAVRWDDPDLAIRWPLAGAPILSAKDAGAPALADTDLFA
jgi:dTDP-4-dehydrorhamnose 3,5-epimerase